MTFYDQDLADAARDAAADAYDDRPTLAELNREERNAAELGTIFGWSREKAEIVAEEYRADRQSGAFDEF